jgi:hypothetical protein
MISHPVARGGRAPKACPPEFRRKVLDLVAGGRQVAQVTHDLEISERTRLLRPSVHSVLCGRNRFHRPRWRASLLSSSRTGGWKCGTPASRILLPVDRLGGVHKVPHELCKGSHLHETSSG